MALGIKWPWDRSESDLPAMVTGNGEDQMLEGEMGSDLASFMAAHGAPGHPVDDEGEAAQDAPAEEPAAPELPEMSEEQRLAVEAYYGRQQEAVRQQMQAYGLDLTAEGRPVVADPNRFSQWSGATAAPRQPAASAAPQPAPPVPEEEDDFSNFDPLQMDGRTLAALIDKRVSKQTAAYQQEIQRLNGQIARRSANEALGSVRDALAAYPWVPPEVVDHPDFAESYRALAASVPPEQLEDPRMKATLALQIAPWLDMNQMQYQPPPSSSPVPRDTQGRFVSHAEAIAQGRVNRQNAGPVPPARGGMTAPPPASRDVALAQNFVRGFAGLQSHTAKYGAPTQEQLEALDERDPMRQYAAFMAARGRR